MAVAQAPKGDDERKAETRPAEPAKKDDSKPAPNAGLDKEVAGKDAVDAEEFAAASDNRYVGRVDEFEGLRNPEGQLAPEDGMVVDPEADEVKMAASSDPTQPYPFGSARDIKGEALSPKKDKKD